MHTSLLPAASLLMRSLGWALLCSLWQSAIIFICLAILLKLFSNITARVKYYLSLSSLAAAAIWFGDTWLNQWQRLQTSTVFITQEGPQTAVTHTISVPTLPQASTSNSILHLLNHLEHYMPLITSVYMIGLVFMLLRFSLNLLQVHKLRRQGLINANFELVHQLSYWQNQLNINKPVSLYLSDRISVPTMMGVIKPVILLPLASISQLSPDQLEAVLIHELAHIKRHDYLLNILQTVVETLLFFNPFIWWMSAITRREREHCCDDIVVSHTSLALSYAKALAQLESYRSVSGTMTLAVTGNKNQLFNRIKRIMEMKKNSVNYSQLSIVLVVIVALVASIAWFTPSYAQHGKTGTTKDTTIKKSQWSVEETYTFTDDNGNTKVYHSYDELPDDKKKMLEEAGGKHSQAHTNVIFKTKDEKKTEDDMPDIGNAIVSALSSVDWDKIGDDVNNAFKDIKIENFNAMPISGEEFKEFRDSVDWKKIQADIKKAMKEAANSIPDEKTRKEVSARLKKQLERLHDQVEREHEHLSMQIEKAKARKEAAEARADARKAGAQTYIVTTDEDDAGTKTTIRTKKIKIDTDNDEDVSLSSGNTSLKIKHLIINTDPADDVVVSKGSGGSGASYERMLELMQKDGLLNRSQDFKIEKYDGVLYINENEQTQETYNKYKRYLTGKKVIIKGGPNRLKITVKE